jgi:4-hydroxybenzoate polyprenyltransferase
MNRYLALSRTTHSLLDIAAPAFCALLWLGDFPPWQVIVLSLVTAFAAYAAIYALNDLVGLGCDKEKFAGSEINPGYAVDGSANRHPLAQGALSVRCGLLWTLTWFVLALLGSYILNPAILGVFLTAAVLEVAYCRLLKVTHFRTLLGGIVKTSGPIAAILVVDSRPAPLFLMLLFVWLFFWEIGGQNIPSDWNDTAEDRRVDAKTIPIRFGLKTAGILLMAALCASVIASAFLPMISPARLGLFYLAVSLLLGYLLLLRPGLQLVRRREGRLAARLFDRASFYPLSQFALISVFLAAEHLFGA